MEDLLQYMPDELEEKMKAQLIEMTTNDLRILEYFQQWNIPAMMSDKNLAEYVNAKVEATKIQLDNIDETVRNVIEGMKQGAFTGFEELLYKSASINKK